MIDIADRESDKVRYYYLIGRAESARRSADACPNGDEAAGYRNLSVVYDEMAARLRRSYCDFNCTGATVKTTCLLVENGGCHIRSGL